MTQTQLASHDIAAKTTPKAHARQQPGADISADPEFSTYLQQTLGNQALVRFRHQADCDPNLARTVLQNLTHAGMAASIQATNTKSASIRATAPQVWGHLQPSSGLDVQRRLAVTPDQMTHASKGTYAQIKLLVFRYHRIDSMPGTTSQDRFQALDEILQLVSTWLENHPKDKKRGGIILQLQAAVKEEMNLVLGTGDFGEWDDSATNVEKARKVLTALDAEKQWFDAGILSEDQYWAFLIIANEKAEAEWGFLPYVEACRMAGTMKGTDWGPKSKLTITQKLEIASIEVKQGMTDGIGYARYMGIKADQEEDPDAQEFVDEQDVKAWSDTLNNVDEEALVEKLGEKKAIKAMAQQEAAKAILKRIFLLLQVGLQYRDRPDDPLKDWEGPVARALSHGGRVNIFLPPVAEGHDPDEFWNWLTGGKDNRKQAGMNWRAAATHGFSWENGEPKEEKLGKASSVSFTKHFGMDLPVGGLGEKNVSGEIILADGTNGHLYINYDPPTTIRGGALLIGVESSSSGKSNPYGKGHDTSGRAGEFSATGGLKRNKLGAEYGGMVVDLRDAKDDFVALLGEFEAEVEQGLENGSIKTEDMLGSVDFGRAYGIYNE